MQCNCFMRSQFYVHGTPCRNQLHYFNRYLTDDHFTDQSHDTEAIENNIHLMYGPEGNS